MKTMMILLKKLLLIRIKSSNVLKMPSVFISFLNRNYNEEQGASHSLQPTTGYYNSVHPLERIHFALRGNRLRRLLVVLSVSGHLLDANLTIRNAMRPSGPQKKANFEDEL
jgi:hypothetical protein